MLTQEQVRIAEIMNGCERGSEFAHLNFDYMADHGLVAAFGCDGSYLAFFGAIFGRYSVGDHMSVFIYNDSVLCTPTRSAVPLQKKTQKSLLQINVEYGYWGNNIYANWLLESNTVAAEFNVRDPATGYHFTNGLVFDMNNLKGVR